MTDADFENLMMLLRRISDRLERMEKLEERIEEHLHLMVQRTEPGNA